MGESFLADSPKDDICLHQSADHGQREPGGGESQNPGNLTPAYSGEGKALEQHPRMGDRTSVGAESGRSEHLFDRGLSVLFPEGPLFLPERRPVGPEEKERIAKQEIMVAAHETETRVDQIVREVVRMADEAVYSITAQDLVSDEDAFCEDVEEASKEEDDEGDDDIRITPLREEEGDHRERDHHVPQSAACKETFI